ncbi:hypothetical protein ACFFU1_17740 [Algibacter miyuki]|uniref:Secreted protein n=1 Tax=Algibacter miyuki TaxID=1306933 RepID=A0ABV5H4C5_9FLAO|nr:hypothetical protein [Algibacter miyuki]MDN3663807.1 hypothetical protein [Algibacter miyuki]
MKQVFHKIISTLMAFVVLFSTLSFAIDMHFCGDKLVETAVFHKTEGCGMDMQKPASEDCLLTKNSCCNNEQLVVNGQDELQLSVDKISFEQQQFIASFVYTYINLFEGLGTDASNFETYHPPCVLKQIYKLDETYLI